MVMLKMMTMMMITVMVMMNDNNYDNDNEEDEMMMMMMMAITRGSSYQIILTSLLTAVSSFVSSWTFSSLFITSCDTWKLSIFAISNSHSILHHSIIAVVILGIFSVGDDHLAHRNLFCDCE